MREHFQIVRVKKTGEQYLAKRYFLDCQKFTLFCKYENDKEPKFAKWGISNEYQEDVEVLGNYVTNKIHFSWKDGITCK